MWAAGVVGANRPAPWRRIGSWSCTMCGECCFHFDVNLRWDEVVKFANSYGREFLLPTPKGFIISRAGERCPFLLDCGSVRVCRLQHGMKPVACKLWPFQVYRRPKYGRERDARFIFEGDEFFVYVDLRCRGVRPGEPSPNLIETVSEAVKLALDPNGVQIRTTSSIFLSTSSGERTRTTPRRSSLEALRSERV
jgi:Fe-S-cluster containining protein